MLPDESFRAVPVEVGGTMPYPGQVDTGCGGGGTGKTEGRGVEGRGGEGRVKETKEGRVRQRLL